jgi:hypothetical protein
MLAASKWEMIILNVFDSVQTDNKLEYSRTSGCILGIELRREREKESKKVRRRGEVRKNEKVRRKCESEEEM